VTQIKHRPRRALRQVKAASVSRAYAWGMADAGRITEVTSGNARCEGRPGRPHAATDIALEPDTVAACPVCGRSFRCAAPSAIVKIDRAAWPKDP
jgi:hypothetical protein